MIVDGVFMKLSKIIYVYVKREERIKSRRLDPVNFLWTSLIHLLYPSYLKVF